MKRIQQFALRALVFAFSLVCVNVCVAQIPATPAQPPVTVGPGTTMINITLGAPRFDGQKVYQEVFGYMRDQNILLQDPAARAKWVAEWEHKHDKDGVLDTEDGTDKACLEMIHSLDQRYNFYIMPEEWRKTQEMESSNFYGVGMPLGIKDLDKIYKALPKNPTIDQIKAANEAAETVSADHPAYVADDPYADSPAAKAGVHADDVIVAVDGKPTLGRKLKDVANDIRGPEGSAVTVTIQRTSTDGKQTTINFTLRRAQIITHAVHFVDEGNGVSYIKVDDFVSELLDDDWADALHKAANGKAIIVDLRGNLGGRVDYVEYMVATLIQQGVMIETHMRNGDNIVTKRIVLQPDLELDMQRSSDKDVWNVRPEIRDPLLIANSMPVVVLVDQNSYSASEIFSGSLKANHRAAIVGQGTGGKGVGQTVDQLGFEREVHVTSFEFLPGGEPMDWVGVIPDYPVKEGDDDVIKHGDPSRDTQLREAIKVAQGLADKQAQLEQDQKAAKQKHEDEFKQRSQASKN